MNIFLTCPDTVKCNGFREFRESIKTARKRFFFWISDPSQEKGFTFLELMVVVVILGLLATYIAPRFMGRTDDAKVVKAKVDIAGLETALKLYKMDNGFYPTTEQGLMALIEKTSTEPIPMNWKEKGYLEKRRIPKDPWGREYLYLCPGIHDDYDLLSYGSDGVPGGDGKDKDINSWDLE